MCLRFLTLTQRHILHYPCRETIFGLSCVVFQSSSIEQSLMKMQKHLRYRRLEALVWPSWQWLFGGWSFSCLAFAGPLVTLSWCPFWLLENWFQNSTFHHCHPAQVRTSQHITQPNYRIICFETINKSIKNIALEPFPCGLNALVQGLRYNLKVWRHEDWKTWDSKYATDLFVENVSLYTLEWLLQRLRRSNCSRHFQCECNRPYDAKCLQTKRSLWYLVAILVTCWTCPCIGIPGTQRAGRDMFGDRKTCQLQLWVNIMVSGIQTWPTDANSAPATCASGALRSWCRPLPPRIVRIHWNFRFFCNMTRLLSIFVQGTRKVNQVGSLPKCRRWLAQPIVYIPNRVGSCRIVVKFFSFDPWPRAELHTIVLQIQWWFVHQCTRQRLLGLDIHWKQPANAKLEIIATSWLPSIATLRQLEMNKKGISPKLQGCPETILDTYVDFVDGICCKGSLRADQSFHQCHWLKRL